MAHEMNLFGCLSQNLRLRHDRGKRGVGMIAPVVIDKSINQLGQPSSRSADWGRTGAI